MAAIFAPVERFCVSRLNQSLADHIYGNLVPEIPAAMMKQLAFEGIWRLVGICYLWVTLPVVICYIGYLLSGDPTRLVSEIQIWVSIAVIPIFILIWGRRGLREPAERELLYRRQHGKWRWDH